MDRDIGFDFNDILSDVKLYKGKEKNILIYGILYKTSINAKPLRSRLEKIDGFIKVQNRVGYSVLFDYRWFDKI